MSESIITQEEVEAARRARAVVKAPGEPMPNARLFVDSRFNHPVRSLLVFQGGEFYGWNGTCWPSIEDGHLRAQIYEHFENATYIDDKGDDKPFAPTKYKVADLIDALRAVTHMPVTVTAPAWLADEPAGADEFVSGQNGLIHVPTRTLHPHTPAYYTHHSVGFDYDAAAAAPVRWMSFLHELWGDDIESIETLQELFGYIVSGDTTQQKMFLIVVRRGAAPFR